MSTADLSQYSSCEISDSLIKLGIPHGGHLPDIHILSPSPVAASDARICGPAYTVKMVMASDKASPKLSTHFVDTAPNGSVIVIDAPPRLVCSPVHNRVISANNSSFLHITYELVPSCRSQERCMGRSHDCRSAVQRSPRRGHLRSMQRPRRASICQFPCLRSRSLDSRTITIHPTIRGGRTRHDLAHI